ncbi:class I glutamine amidotransferase-like protein [Sporormia fimetaria CBS 119925]|uniref:Class I glutamine amidotransferase-like protein n=1 Tax=Sporormia fimetaria CBS 119925 TaxID=1340428 RepID=A0A6A6UY20_9PLEO|nr:class I glutamine amidotransferase-like protein [Sporormia fimetaria CBS 119925]
MEPFRVLIFSKTTGYRHDSIPAGISAIRALPDRSQRFTVDDSEDAQACFTPSNLQKYTVVVLLQNTGDFLNPTELDALRQYVRSGGGLVAIHGAAAGLLNDDWYGSLIGVHFDHHPKPEEGNVLVEESAREHPILKCYGGREGWMDEWYNFTTHPRKNVNLKVLLRGDANTFQGGIHGDDHPLSWCQEFEGARVWFTALGHFDEAYRDDWFMGQVERGIMWTAKKDE